MHNVSLSDAQELALLEAEADDAAQQRKSKHANNGSLGRKPGWRDERRKKARDARKARKQSRKGKR